MEICTRNVLGKIILITTTQTQHMQSKYWVFTENTNAQAFADNLPNLYTNGKVKYICGQLEIASTGQLHFQGYVQLARSQRISYLKNNVSSTAHFEKQRGSNQQARDYCCKEDETTVANTFNEFGEFFAGGKPGNRTDIHSFRDAIISGKTQRELIESEEHLETFAKYIKMHDRIRSLYPTKRKREDEWEVHLFYGSPGTGKTRKAVEDHPDLFEVPISNGTLWFDGYDSHEVVLFDDFMGAGSKMSLDNTLKFFDRYVRKIPIKGAHVWYTPNKIIVTSNYHPRAWYKWNGREESYQALKRRFTHITIFEDDGEQVEQTQEEFFEDRDLWPQIELIQ